MITLIRGAQRYFSFTTGTQLGISTTQPGYFDAAASPKLLRATDTNILRIL